MADLSKPIAPTVTATLTQRVVLKWSGASDNVGIARYEAWDGDKFLAELKPTTRQYTTPPLPAGTHALRIVAYDAAGNYANSPAVSVTVPATGVPAAPAPTPAPAPAPAVASRFQRLVFEDTFDGPAVDTAKWYLYTSPGNHAAEPGIRSASAWTIENGRLVCTAKNAPDGQIVTGGMSMRNVTLRGGRWEWRCRTDVDPTRSLSGVVLLWPTGSARRSDGELDIYETGTYASRRPFSSFIHYGGAAGDLQQQVQHDADGAEWHTMAVDWDPGIALRIFRDGALISTITDAAKMPVGADHLCIQFDAFAKRTLPAPLRMEIDYVRVWAA